MTITNADLNADLMVGTLAPAASTTVDIVFEVDSTVADPSATIDISLAATATEVELDTANDDLLDSVPLGTGAVLNGMTIEGSNWTTYNAHPLTLGSNPVLPWVTLNTLTVTYATPLPVAPSFVLQGPTDGSTINLQLTSWDGTTAVYTKSSALTKGYYRAGTANTSVDFGVLPGDSTGNGQVNFADFGVFGPSFGSSGLGPLAHKADYTGNGRIDFSDFGVFGPSFGSNLDGFTPPTDNPPPPPPMSPTSLDAVWARLADDLDDEDKAGNN